MRLLTDKSTRGSSSSNNNNTNNSMIEPSGIEMSYFLDKPEGKPRARWRNDSGDKKVLTDKACVKVFFYNYCCC